MNKTCELDLNGEGSREGSLSVTSNGERSADNREIFTYIIRNGEGEILSEGSDLKSGVGGDVPAEKMMASLLSFLGAAAEARGPESDNWDLFNEATREWAQANSDELAMLEVEMEDRELEETESEVVSAL
jgi:hypothetical protein